MEKFIALLADEIATVRSLPKIARVARLHWRGRCWLEELLGDPTATAETIAKREGYTSRKVNMTISLAFLAPDLVKVVIDGTVRTAWESLASLTCRPSGPNSIRCLAF